MIFRLICVVVRFVDLLLSLAETTKQTLADKIKPDPSTEVLLFKSFLVNLNFKKEMPTRSLEEGTGIIFDVLYIVLAVSKF